MTNLRQTEIEKHRIAWWAEHYKPGMSFSEVVHLNEELAGSSPVTQEERDQRAKELEGVPEFVR